MQKNSATGLVAGKTAFVTGAAKGLGSAIVARLADEGAVGTAFDILDPEAAGVLPAGWIYQQGDVTVEDDIGAAMATAGGDRGRLDIVVANAGVTAPWRETAELDLEELRGTFAVNVEGTAITIKHAARCMKQHGGSIVAMGSLNSWQGHPQQAAYVASKHAVLGLVKASALDLGQHGIRVNALAPGPIATKALVGRVKARAAGGETSADTVLEEMAQAGALKRMASAAEVAAACVFLASDLSGGITGQLIPVDAGLP